MSATHHRTRTPVALVVAALAAACADPGPVGEDHEDRARAEVTSLDTEGEADAPTLDAPTHTGDEEPGSLTSSPEDAIRSYRGPRIEITANPDLVSPGVPILLRARLTDADGRAIDVTEDTRFAWRLPEGWTLEGEGADVTVTPPEALAPGETDIGVAVERGGSPLVRGGVILRSGA